MAWVLASHCTRSYGRSFGILNLGTLIYALLIGSVMFASFAAWTVFGVKDKGCGDCIPGVEAMLETTEAYALLYGSLNVDEVELPDDKEGDVLL